MRTIRTLLCAIRRTTNSLPHLFTALALTLALTLPARAAETKIVDLSATNTNATSNELYNIANGNTWGTGDSQITAVITGTPGKKNSTAYTCFTGGSTKYYYPSLASGVAMEFKLPASGDFYISKVIINYVNNSSSNASNSAGYIFIDADGATMTGTNDKGSLTAQAYNACNNLTLTPTSLTAKSFKFGRNVNSVSGSEGRVAHIEIWVEEDASSGGGDIDCGGTPTLSPASLGAVTVDQYSTPSPLTFTATPQNGGTLTYQWYQWLDNETEADKIPAVGTGANTNSFTPDVTTASVRHYICLVTEAGCTNGAARLEVGAYTVTPAALPAATSPHCITLNSSTPASGTTSQGITLSYVGNGSITDNNGINFSSNNTHYVSVDIGSLGHITQIVANVKAGSTSTTKGIRYVFDEPSTVSGGTTLGSISTAFHDETITAPDNTRTKFTITRWSTSLYVKSICVYFEANTNYSVTYNANGATSGTAPTDANSPYGSGATVTVLGNTGNLAKTSKNFGGWNTAADGSGTTFAAGATFTISQDVTLYALWEDPCVAPTNVTISGDYAYLAGQTISLTATATGHTGLLSYQWQKEISTGNWQDISGATSATYTKANCGWGDSGSYRCAVTAGGECTYISTPYDVHVFQINGGYDGGAWQSYDINYVSGTTGKAIIHLEAGRLFKFKVWCGREHWFGNGQADYNGDGTGEHADDGWYTLGNISNWYFEESGKNFRLYTGPEGDYEITVDVQYGLQVNGSVLVSITYPTVQHPAEGYAYFEKPSEWNGVYLYWYSNDNWRLSGWYQSPEITTTTTICGTTYYYTPLGDSFDYLIFRDGGSNQWTYIPSTGFSGKYLDKTDYANPAWAAFTDYTITFAGNGSTAGTMAAVDDIPCGTNVTLPANTFTKEGNAFNGWVADVDVTVNNSTITAGNLIPDAATLQNVTSDIELTAQWCPVVNILSADAVGGSNNNITATGTIGGTAQCYLSSSKKLGTSGQYFFVKLAGGELMPGDIINLNLITASANGSYVGKVALFTGDKDNHTYYIDMPAPNVGDNFFTLPADFPSGVNGIGLYRDATHDHNPFINSLSISRTNCAGLTAPTVTVTADNATPCPGADVTLTATPAPANAPITSYQWFKADGTQLTGSTNSITVAPEETTEYYCVAYTLLFKAQSANVTVTPKSVSITGADAVECTKTITLTGSGNGTWAITAGSSFATLSANSGTEVGLTGVAEGIVTVSFTYNGCSVSKTITVGPKLNDECMTFDAHTLNYQHSEGITTLYYINSSGVISQSQVFQDGQSIDAVGTKGTTLSQKRFDLVFDRPVKTIILYGYGSDERTVAKVAVSPSATKNSYTNLPYSTAGSTYEAKQQTVVLTADSYFPSDKFIWIEFSNTLKVYRICVFYKETENLIFTTAGDWNTAGNWNLGYVPSSVDNATINAAASLATTGTEVNDLTIGSGSLEIAQTGMLKVNGTMLNNDDTKLTVNIPGGLAIADGMATVRARVNFHSAAKVVNGNYRWQYIGWPFTALADVHWPFSGSWLATYVTTNEGTDMDWAYLSNGDGLTPFKGYALTQAAEKDFTFYGALNPPSTQNLDLTYLDDDHKWNLIANSWLAPLNVATFNVATDFYNADATFHIFNTGSKAEYGEGAGGAEYNNAGQYTTITPEFAANKPNGISIPPMQGFFIEPNAPNASVTLDYNRHVLGAASYSEAGPMRTPRRERPVYIPVTMINITVKGEVFGDEVNLMESDKYTDGYDNGADGRKVLGAETSPQICAETAYGLMAILATPNLEGTIIDFKAGTEDQVYTLTFENNDGDIYITDLLTGTETKIEDENSYTFTASNTEELQARFRLSRTSVAPPDNPTSLEQTGAQGYSVINRDGTITIAAPANANIKYILLDAAGKTITQGTASGNVNIDVPQNGVYMLRIGNKTHKIVR